MYIYIWKFHVTENKRQAFENLYGLTGAWVTLFKKHPGYIKTEFLCDLKALNTYLTIDCWESQFAYEGFRQRFAEEFEELDKMGGLLTQKEEFIGEYNS